MSVSLTGDAQHREGVYTGASDRQAVDMLRFRKTTLHVLFMMNCARTDQRMSWKSFQ